MKSLLSPRVRRWFYIIAGGIAGALAWNEFSGHHDPVNGILGVIAWLAVIVLYVADKEAP